MTDLIDRKRDAARQQTLGPAARRFAVMPYRQVSLADILTNANCRRRHGFANPERLPYLTGFITRRSTLTVRNAAPMGIDKL